MGKHYLSEKAFVLNYKVSAFPSWLSESLTRPIFSLPLLKSHLLGSAKTFWHVRKFHPLLHSCPVSPRKAAYSSFLPTSCEQISFQNQWLLRDFLKYPDDLFCLYLCTSHLGTVQHLSCPETRGTGGLKPPPLGNPLMEEIHSIWIDHRQSRACR